MIKLRELFKGLDFLLTVAAANVAAFTFAAATKSYGFEGVAILGDSLSTGAATHPKLEFDAKVLWDVFNGSTDLSVTPSMIPIDFQEATTGLEPPNRIGPSSRENDGGSGWIWHNVIQAVSSRALETQRLSYSYLVGRRLGFPAKEILIAGENGTTSRHAWLHAARIVETRGKDLPSKIVFFYTGNDLCAQTMDEIIDGEGYGQELLKGMKYLVLNGNADSHGTKIYIPGFLPVTSLLHEPSILAHKIRLHGEELTCQEARMRLFAPKIVAKGDPKSTHDATVDGHPKAETADLDPQFQVFSTFMPPSPVLLCPTLFGSGQEDSTRQSLLANRIRSFRENQRKAVMEFNRWRGSKFPGRAFDAVYIDETETIKFEGLDMAADCFHLSALGQAKIASALYTRMR
jgi:hypothetical protein